MVLTKEYRICMPLTTEEYRIGQRYMTARHSHEQSDNDQGVEVVENVECNHPDHGKGQYTEKRIHLSSKLPYWIQSVLPRIFYVTEKAWNYYPFTITANDLLASEALERLENNGLYVRYLVLLQIFITIMCGQKWLLVQLGKINHQHWFSWNVWMGIVGDQLLGSILPNQLSEYTCSFIPKFNISIRTRYENNNGSTENCLGLSPIEVLHREVDFVDIAYDEISAKHYKEEEDPKFFQSQRTGRGPLVEGWRDTTQPIMCSYKLVHASFEVWGMQTRVEDFLHRCIRDILLLGHRQAFTWIDEWYDMTMEDVKEYERKMHTETNEKVRLRNQNNEKPMTPSTPISSVPSSPVPQSPTQSNRSYFFWS